MAATISRRGLRMHRPPNRVCLAAVDWYSETSPRASLLGSNASTTCCARSAGSRLHQAQSAVWQLDVLWSDPAGSSLAQSPVLAEHQLSQLHSQSVVPTLALELPRLVVARLCMLWVSQRIKRLQRDHCMRPHIPVHPSLSSPVSFVRSIRHTLSTPNDATSFWSGILHYL